MRRTVLEVVEEIGGYFGKERVTENRPICQNVRFSVESYRILSSQRGMCNPGGSPEVGLCGSSLGRQKRSGVIRLCGSTRTLGVYRCVSIVRLVRSAVLAFLVKLADAECTGSIPTGVSQRHFVTFKMKCHSAANIIWRLCLLRGGTAGRAATRQTGGWVDSK